jgi:hypothetical protein
MTIPASQHSFYRLISLSSSEKAIVVKCFCQCQIEATFCASRRGFGVCKTKGGCHVGARSLHMGPECPKSGVARRPASQNVMVCRTAAAEEPLWLSVASAILSAFRTWGVPGPTSKFVVACPAQMGWCEMEHKRGNEPCIILHQGARSRGYKRCERARARERA